jgi:hypothetical protein
MSGLLLKHLERKRLEQKERAEKAKADSDEASTREPIVVRDELLNIVDSWMANSTSLVRAPAHAVDIMQQAVDGRAGLGATFNDRQSTAVRTVSDDSSSKALDSSVVRLKRRIALDEDDQREDQRFANSLRAPDDQADERGRSDAVVSRKRPAVDGGHAQPAINSRLLSRTEKNREKRKRKQLAKMQQKAQEQQQQHQL